MDDTLATITVTGAYAGDFSNWGDCFNNYNYSSNQYFAFALSYLYSDDVFWDLNRSLENGSANQCIRRMLQASSLYDNLPAGQPSPQLLLAGYYRSSPDTPYVVPGDNVQSTYWGVFKAASHWLWGNGVNVQMSIEDIGIKPTLDGVGTTSLPLIKVIGDSLAPGVYEYDSGLYGYETYKDAALPPKLIVGGISIRTRGTLTRRSDGSYIFAGWTTAADDRFNMDKRPGRPWWADRVVDLFHSIGGKDYTVKIT